PRRSRRSRTAERGPSRGCPRRANRPRCWPGPRRARRPWPSTSRQPQPSAMGARSVPVTPRRLPAADDPGRVRGPDRDQQLFLAVDERVSGVIGELEVVSQEDRILGTCLLAIAAEDAAEHVDLIALGVALARGVPLG